MVSQDEQETLVHAFVSSRLDDSNSLFTYFNKKEPSSLKYVQNSSERILTPVLKSFHFSPCCLQSKILNPGPDNQSSPCTGSRPHHWADPTIHSSCGQRSSNQHLLKKPKTWFKTQKTAPSRGSPSSLLNVLPLFYESKIV